MAIARTAPPPAAATGSPTERWAVPGGGARAVELEEGDLLDVVDLEGGQAAEVLIVGPPDALGRRPAAPPTWGIGRDGRTGSLVDAFAWLLDGLVRSTRLAPEDRPAPDAPVLRIDGAAVPGERERLVADRSCVVVVGAPGAPMEPGAHDPPTPLWLEVRRADPLGAGPVRLPEPLREAPNGAPIEPRLDLRVDARTARGYEVQAGEWIQIIDLAGRQCSDFLAFSAADGAFLDSTATRTLMGAAIPGPGLHPTFFDERMRPLVEVHRDTVGRHDTFALACTARYYEDAGFPGHANCTDNFNGAVAPYGIGARTTWPAINFFYNTSFDTGGNLLLDEPWSRPGDHVLLRASTDLVCASSACPDDIDPANGWDPTDVHVRVYEATRTFTKAMAHRVTPDAPPTLTRESAFHPRTAALTRRHVDYRGFWLPTSFSPAGDPIEEYWACRERAVVMDLSPLRKFEVLGPGAESLLQATVTRNVRRLGIGRVVYTAICNDAGGMIDDATVFRFGPDTFRVVAGDEWTGMWLRDQARRLGLRAHVRSSTDQLHNLAVQGPSSRDLLRPLIWTAPTQPTFDELTWFGFTVGRIGHREGTPIVVSRTGYSGELGYELWCHPADGPALWDAVWSAGEPHGLRPLGLDALDVLRIESGLVFAGSEFDDTIDPFEAGIGFTVALKHGEDFVGRDALLERKEHPQRTLVGLELDGSEIAAHGDCVHVGRQQVGVITSGTRSPVLQRNIALARVAVRCAELGTEVEVGKLDGYQKRISARVVRFPFYDPDKTKPRS